jgi:hypothetical protein
MRTSDWVRAGLRLVLAGVPLCASPAAHAQVPAASGQQQSRPGKERQLPDRLPERPTVAPAFSIPSEPLGFSPPGAIYLAQRWSLASLDFLDEDHLLFTFRVPGLIHREAGSSADSEAHQIRAVVLSLPSGTVQAEALWSIHDHARYLWMLRDGHFLLRDRDKLLQGDASLKLKPLLRFPGPLLWLELDPTQQFMVTNSLEPAGTASIPGEVSSPSTASATVVADGLQPVGEPDVVVRILRRDSGQVMLVSRYRAAVHLPINSDGYLDGVREDNGHWLLNLKYFSGGSKVLGRVDSSCSPTLDFVSQEELLASVCIADGYEKLMAMSTDGRRLWGGINSNNTIWPLVITSADGSRLAREALVVTRPVNPNSPLDQDDIKGQLVLVFDAANGKMVLATSASPPLDAGGNVAISPSGRRAAVLNAGAIQVFELPAPTPATGAASESHAPSEPHAH